MAGRLGGTTSAGRLGTKSVDLSTVEGLAKYGRSVGLGKQVDEITDTTPKLSILQRLSRGLSAFNPAEAILTGVEKKSVGSGLGTYAKTFGQSIGSAVTGRDFGGEKRYFADVADKLGIENRIARFGVGFMGDILLDPSTYFGGAIARGLVKGTGAIAGATLKGVGKVAPEIETGLRLAGQGAKDAVGRAFQFGYGASKGAREDVLTQLSKLDEAKVGLAESNLERLGVQALTPDQRKELVTNMIANKRAEFGARESGIEFTPLKSSDPKVQSVMDELSTRSQKFAKGADIEDPYINYYPFIKKQNLEKFFRDINSQGIKVGSESYRKQFKNLLTDEAMELDPAKAFFTREAQMVTDRMNRDFLSSFVERYGKPLQSFKSADEAATNGYKVLKEKGMFGKELGYVSKADHNLIRDALAPEFQTISMLAKATGFDALTSLFKRSVTGLFLPFHVRNWVSGVIQNYETIGVKALDPVLMNSGRKFAYNLGKGLKDLPKSVKGEKNIIKLGGKSYDANKLYRSFADRFGGSSFYTTDFLKAVDLGEQMKQVAPILSKARFKETVKTAGLGQEAVHFKIGRVVGQFLEHQQKATAYLGALSQGKSIKAALQIAENAGFDYRALTRFESQIMRRLIPFYSFARKNIGLQLRTLGYKPQRINHIIAVIRNLGVPISDEEMENLPEYMKEALIAKIGMSENGLQEFIVNFGTPIEAFAQLFDDKQVLRTISMMNPIVKVPIEIGIGKDSFRQKDLKDVYTANEYSAAPQIIKDLLQLREVKKDQYKKIGGKLVKSGSYTQYVADPERLLILRALPTSRGVAYLDTLFDGDLDSFGRYLKLVTGVKPQEVDPDIAKGIRERDMKRDLEDLLIRDGQVKRFQNVYQPK